MPDEHVPTDESRRLAKQLSGVGVPQEDICHILGITKPTLHKHYRRELDLGMAEANAKVAGSLFNQATSGNIPAAIFWMKARAGWREKQEMQLNVSGDLSTLSDAAILALVGPADEDGDQEGDPASSGDPKVTH